MDTSINTAIVQFTKPGKSDHRIESRSRHWAYQLSVIVRLSCQGRCRIWPTSSFMTGRFLGWSHCPLAVACPIDKVDQVALWMSPISYWRGCHKQGRENWSPGSQFSPLPLTHRLSRSRLWRNRTTPVTVLAASDRSGSSAPRVTLRPTSLWRHIGLDCW